LYDDAGKVVGASKTARDITERKRSEELKNLLLGELNHRVKNTLAIIQSIATQTLRRAPSPPDFVSSFSGRVQALARAHTLFTRDSWQGTHIADLVRDQLMLDNNDERISYSGPPVAMDPQVAVNFSMILHELGTNARKYGALSVAGGRLSVKWELLPGSRGGTESILLCWIERGGPLVHEPLRHGFGTMLIEKGLKTYGGEAELQYDPEGLICIIRLPLPKGTLADSTLSLPRNGHSAFLLEHDRISLNGKRILIIEDEPLVWMDIETFLSESGSIIVGPAGNIDSARLLIEAEKFDGVLMDANLGGQPVDELAAALVKRNIPFVFLTGYGRESLPKAFRDSRMVAKPYTREQLLTAAAQMFEPDVVD
jgi:two-component sensor histidine kinase/CheY-like chemotaxis protein